MRARALVRTVLAPPVAVLALVGLAACTSSAGGTEVAVTGTDTACTPADTELRAGKTTFVFTNRAKDVSELYVKTADGRIVKEVENVATGTRRNLTVDLRAGTYLLNCKPGQRGDGIVTEVRVTGSGGAAPKAADRTVSFRATEYRFEGLVLDVTSGETIDLEMTNVGGAEHELEVLTPGGEVLGEVGETKPGAVGRATLTFDEPGTYTFVCDVDDHASRGMRGTFVVR